MADVSLAEDDHLFPVFHLAVPVHIHAVHKNLIVKFPLHLGHVHHVPVRQLLKLLIVDVCPVHGEDLIMLVMARRKHEGVVGGSGREADVTWHALIGMYDGMDLDAAFLLTRPGMPAHALEDGVGEQRNGGGVYDTQPLYPLLAAVSPAVRRKPALVPLVQVAVYFLEELLRPPGIRI